MCENDSVFVDTRLYDVGFALNKRKSLKEFMETNNLYDNHVFNKENRLFIKRGKLILIMKFTISQKNIGRKPFRKFNQGRIRRIQNA
jgi:hypothetical protein